MCQSRTFVINETTSKRITYDLQHLQIDEEWNYVIHEAITDYIEMKSVESQLIICFMVSLITIVLLVIAIPFTIGAQIHAEMDFLNKMSRRQVGVNEKLLNVLFSDARK
jgi:hypothetical protein